MNTHVPAIDIGSEDGAVFRGWELEKYVVRCDMDRWNHPNFVQCNAHNLPFKDKSFETAVLGEILEHVVEPCRVLREAMRVSRRIVITTPIEQEWDSSALPHTNTLDDTIKKYGSLDEFYHNLKSRNKELIEKVSDLQENHSFHIREWTLDSFREFVEKCILDNWQILELKKEKMGNFMIILCILSEKHE